MKPFSNCPNSGLNHKPYTTFVDDTVTFQLFKLKPGLPGIETQILAEAKLSETF
jgi:hypothetical protein